MVKKITLPTDDDTIRDLQVGDSVLISGVMLTGRDAVHKWLTDRFIYKMVTPTSEEMDVYQAIKPILNGGVIYHCGPVVSGLDTKRYKFVAAGPTTSIREEPYQGDVMSHFNIKGVIGKGGMGTKTLNACQNVPGVYFHAIGGVAALIANCVQKVITVHMLEFGVPEAIWVIEVKDFPAVVTMDSHGNSLHEAIRAQSKAVLDRLLQ
jgi:tartrate/fumarate subfamily iron-sulfur-dependent hydro-lyase beta chain